MSATVPQVAVREVAISERITALRSGHSLEYQYRNEQGDFALATSFWQVSQAMTDEDVRSHFAENEAQIQLDFDEGLAMRE